MNKRAKWTTPFHGVQHLDGLARGYQITVTDRESFADCSVFVPGSGFNAKVSQHADAATARAHGEAQADALEAR